MTGIGPGWAVFAATVAARGHWPAVVQGDDTTSFAALGALARSLAAVLAGRSVGQGDRVVLHLGNSVWAVALPVALWSIGALPVFAPGDMTRTALDDIATRVGAKGVISDSLTDCAAAPLWPLADLVAARGKGGPEVAPATEPDALGPDALGPDALGSVVFTSGSTGRPKGVMQTQAALLDGAFRVSQAVGYGPDDRLLVAVPFSHDYGWGQVLSAYRLGLTLILPKTPGLAGIPEAIERHRPTVLGGVPSVYAGLTRGVSDVATRDRSSVRLVMSTGSAMPQRVWHDLAALFPGARRCLNYGLTETFRSATLREADAHLAPGVVGTALPGAGLAIVDEAGQVCAAGVWGQIVHRGAGAFVGYWDDPAQTAARLRPDPLGGPGNAVFTGDRGMLDAAGRLTVGDRLDRMVKVMGLAASPLAIEEVLRAVPGVQAAAVVFAAHEILGTELHAVLVAAPGVIEAALQVAASAATRAALAPHERPRRWHFRAALPLTASGKVDLVGLTKAVTG